MKRRGRRTTEAIVRRTAARICRNDPELLNERITDPNDPIVRLILRKVRMTAEYRKRKKA